MANNTSVCVLISFRNFGIAIMTMAEVKNTIPAKVAIEYANPTKILEDDEKSGNPAPTLKYSEVKY